MPKFGDFPIVITDKHKAMEQAVSSNMRKGRGLADKVTVPIGHVSRLITRNLKRKMGASTSYIRISMGKVSSKN